MFNIIYATISFLSFGLVLLIFPWFIRFRSIPGLFACVWLLVVNFIFGLNAAAFTGDILLRAPVYCDVGERHEFPLTRDKESLTFLFG